MALTGPHNLRTFPKSVRRATNGTAPDWEITPHKGKTYGKGETLPAKEEIMNEVKALAKKAAKATTEKERKENAKQMAELTAQYVSAASSDRKALYDEAVKAIGKSRGSKNGSIGLQEEKVLMDFIYENKSAQQDAQNTMQLDRPYALGDLATITASKDKGGKINYVVAVKGEAVMTFGPGGFTGAPRTKEEQKLEKEITDAYHGAAKGAAQKAQADLAPKRRLDMKI